MKKHKYLLLFLSCLVLVLLAACSISGSGIQDYRTSDVWLEDFTAAVGSDTFAGAQYDEGKLDVYVADDPVNVSFPPIPDNFPVDGIGRAHSIQFGWR